MGVALLLLFLQIFGFIGLGTPAQAIGQVTFAISYVVVIVRGRLVSIGREYEEAAADLGAPAARPALPRAPAAARAGDPRERRRRLRALDRRLRRSPSTSPAGADTNTVSMLLYATARGAPTPALNALATITLADHAADARARVPRLPPLRRRRARAAAVGTLEA